MATAKNSSTRTTRAPAGAIAKPASPRPMLCHSDDEAEAINSVRNVLWFMAAVMREGFDFAGDQKMLDGAGLILETCSETLSFHLPKGQKGGAA